MNGIPWITEDGETVTLAVHRFPENRRGIRPTIGCAQRLLWFTSQRIPQLQACLLREPAFPAMGCTNNSEGATVPTCMIPAISRTQFAEHIESAKRENPARIAAMQRDYSLALAWETKRYGNVAAILHTAQEMRDAA